MATGSSTGLSDEGRPYAVLAVLSRIFVNASLKSGVNPGIFRWKNRHNLTAQIVPFSQKTFFARRSLDNFGGC